MKSRSLASPRKRGDSAAPSRTCSPLDLSPAEPDAAEPPPPYGGGTISRIHPFTVRRSPGPLSQGQFGGSTCAGVRSLEADRAWGGKGFAYEANAGNRESGRGSSGFRHDARSAHPSGQACSSTLLGHHRHRCGGRPPKHSRTSGGQLSEGSGVPAPPVTQHSSQRQ